jgi:hypothetical protein
VTAAFNKITNSLEAAFLPVLVELTPYLETFGSVISEMAPQIQSTLLSMIRTFLDLIPTIIAVGHAEIWIEKMKVAAANTFVKYLINVLGPLNFLGGIGDKLVALSNMFDSLSGGLDKADGALDLFGEGATAILNRIEGIVNPVKPSNPDILPPFRAPTGELSPAVKATGVLSPEELDASLKGQWKPEAVLNTPPAKVGTAAGATNTGTTTNPVTATQDAAADTKDAAAKLSQSADKLSKAAEALNPGAPPPTPHNPTDSIVARP